MTCTVSRRGEQRERDGRDVTAQRMVFCFSSFVGIRWRYGARGRAGFCLTVPMLSTRGTDVKSIMVN